jgi:hypothetical protein
MPAYVVLWNGTPACGGRQLFAPEETLHPAPSLARPPVPRINYQARWQRRICRVLRARGPLSRAWLVAHAGLSPDRVTEALRALRRAGRVRVIGTETRTTPGRRRQLYAIVPRH